jgi:hypothetical protein
LSTLKLLFSHTTIQIHFKLFNHFVAPCIYNICFDVFHICPLTLMLWFFEWKSQSKLYSVLFVTVSCYELHCRKYLPVLLFLSFNHLQYTHDLQLWAASEKWSKSQTIKVSWSDNAMSTSYKFAITNNKNQKSRLTQLKPETKDAWMQAKAVQSPLASSIPTCQFCHIAESLPLDDFPKMINPFYNIQSHSHNLFWTCQCNHIPYFSP